MTVLLTAPLQSTAVHPFSFGDVLPLINYFNMNIKSEIPKQISYKDSKFQNPFSTTSRLNFDEMRVKNNPRLVPDLVKSFLPSSVSPKQYVLPSQIPADEWDSDSIQSDDQLKTQVPSDCMIALSDLPVGCHSSDRSITSQILNIPSDSNQRGVHLTESGVVDWEGSVVTDGTLAQDVHSTNTLICLGASPGSIKMRIIKHIGKYQPIMYWFSQDIIALLDIPFLKPSNIRGEKCYECDRCQTKFEHPNPLKMHIWSDCKSKSNIEQLWKKLQIKTSSAQSQNKSFHFALSTSAFRPYHRSEEHQTGAEAVKPITCFKLEPYTHDSLMNQPYSRIENLVANMGSNNTRQGHLCVYCGKIYSRKYGLKIHIRTHTGFKPLKCKYCLRPFGDPSNLNKHVRLHVQAQTPYKCDLCSKILVRRRDLERHIRSRHHAELNL